MRFSGHFWRSSEEMISEVLLWEPLHGQRKPGRPNKTYTAQPREDSGCTTDELKTVMGNRDEWRNVSCYAEQARPGKVRYILILQKYFRN